MPSLLVENGRVLVDGETGRRLVDTNLRISTGLIEAIGQDLEPADRTLDARGLIVVPGLINAHVHSPGNFMRGCLDGHPLEIFMLYEVPPLADSAEDPDIVRLRTLLGAAEMLELGITSVMDDAYFVPLAQTSSIDAIMGAYEEIGIRATVALDQPLALEYDKYPFLAEILPETTKAGMRAAPRETQADMLAHYERLIADWHGAANGRLRVAVSCSAPQRVPESYMQQLHALSATHDLPFFCHLLETRLQVVLGANKYGRSLIAEVARQGVLDERMLAIHAIWIDDCDIELLADSGCTVAHNPVCNMRLGSGVMPFRALRDAGVPICLGTDEAVSDDTHNVWQAMKMAGLIHNIAGASDDRSWPRAAEILDCVWQGGARAMRKTNELGSIRVGAKADLALLDAASFAFVPLNDIERQMVYAEHGRSVRHTIVDGAIVVEDGTICTIDRAELTRAVQELAPKIREGQRSVQRSAAALEKSYRAMLEKSLAQPVDINRWVRS